MVRECPPPSFVRNGVDSSRPEYSGAITSRPIKPAIEQQPAIAPKPRATIGEGARLVLHVLDGVDRIKGVCGAPIENAVPHLGLEHWGITGASWCRRCTEKMGWK